MSQHADILTHEISKGIRRGMSAAVITTDIGDLLDCLEYPADWTTGKTLIEHVYGSARNMRFVQRDGLYGVSHAQLDKFLDEMWVANQWLPVKI